MKTKDTFLQTLFLFSIATSGKIYMTKLHAAGAEAYNSRTVRASAPTNNIKICTKAAEELTIKHFMALYKERLKTEEGRKDVINRIKQAKRMQIIRAQGDPTNNLTLLSTKDESNKLYNQIQALKKNSRKNQQEIKSLEQTLEKILKPKKDAINTALNAITVNPDDDKDLALICACGMDNNMSDRDPQTKQIIPFSSPFEFGLQAIKQCRDHKNNIPRDPELPNLWKGEQLP